MPLLRRKHKTPNHTNPNSQRLQITTKPSSISLSTGY
jgi:hypothetical protein